MLNTISFSLPEPLMAEVEREASVWISEGRVARLWAKDASVWTGDDEAKWLGWLEIADEERANLDRYAALTAEIKEAGFSDVVLMGMGGSSLCPEVLALSFGAQNFHILDSTVPSQIAALEKRLDLSKTLFIVASKSGSTLEPNCFKQYFFERVSEVVGKEKAGQQFIAVTDPGSKMEQIAKGDGFRHIFYGKPEVGGRFSALSAFGLTAAASMGLDVAKLLSSADEMSSACRTDEPLTNPGALLGLILGICQRNGRDKLTIFTSPEIFDLGAWLEQLVAESTGKNGVAIIPIDREPVQPAVSYGNDRVFVEVALKGSGADPDAEHVRAIAQSGQPFVSIEVADVNALAQEFFRWEFATAVAGAVMKINPFNQPDVEAAKIEARKLTDEYERTGELPAEEPFFESNGISLFAPEDHARRLRGMVDEPRLAELLSAHFATLEEGDYFALLAYLEMNEENDLLVRAIRARVLQLYLAPTCLGFGPRFLHSTGQAYKGGPNTGVFLQITADDAEDLAVPGQKYTFGVVKDAQSRGDFQVLVDRGRRALRLHISGDIPAALKRILSMGESGTGWAGFTGP
jgi:transaldolase/glucose-6-phosphate isomerase